MKKILATLITVPALFVGSYYVTGYFTERTLKNDVALLNESSAFKAYFKSWNRGWFTSNANFDWVMQVPERVLADGQGGNKVIPAQNLTVNTPLTIYHGPLMFTPSGVKAGLGYAETELVLPDEYLRQFNELFTPSSNKPIINISALVNFAVNSRFTTTVPKFTLISRADGSEFRWHGMQNVVVLGYNMGKIAGDMNIAGLDIVNGNKKFSLNDVGSTYHLARDKKSGLYVGNADIAFKTISAAMNNITGLQLDNFALDTESSVQNNLFNMQVKLGLDKLFADNKNYGPAKVSLELHNLDAKVLNDINSKFADLQDSGKLSKEQFLWMVLPELPKMLNRGASIALTDGDITLPEGKLTFDLKLALQQGDLDNPFQLMQKLQGEGFVRVAKPAMRNILLNATRNHLLRERAKATVVTVPATPALQTSQTAPAVALTNDQIDQQAVQSVEVNLQAMQQSGLLVSESDDFFIKLDYHDGKLFVNGKSFNANMLNF